MTLLHPERVAASWLRSGVPLLEQNPDRTSIKVHHLPEAALRVPIMCNPGTKEGVTLKTGKFARVWPANETFILKVRAKGGLLGLAVDPLTAHECGNSRYLAIPWLDACLRARLPAKVDDPLKPMPTDKAWLAPLLGKKAVPAAKFSGDKKQAIWLPDAKTARLWMQFVKDTKVADDTPPPTPTHLKTKGNVLTWKAKADFESGLSHFIIERDGEEIGTVPEKPGNRFGRPLFQGLQYSDTPAFPLVQMTFADKDGQEGKKHAYRVVAVNTAGLRSK